MAKKYIKRAASLHFYDRSEEKKESKNEIFFFSQKILCLEEFEKKCSVSLLFFFLFYIYELSMISSKWKGEKAGHETLHVCNTCLLRTWKMIEKHLKGF